MKLKKSKSDIPLGRYRHYKGKDYQVLGVARHSETEESFVVYRTLYGDFSLWIRPKSMFLGYVLKDGVKVKRFKYLRKEIRRPSR